MKEPIFPDPSDGSVQPQGASSRRAFLAASAAAAAALAVAGSPTEATAAPGQVVKATEGGQFREALRKLATDTAYRNGAGADPKKLMTDFKLSMQDLRNLRDAAVLSGVDVNEVDKLITKAETGPVTADDINQCCCCCCCCGETGVFFEVSYVG